MAHGGKVLSPKQRMFKNVLDIPKSIKNLEKLYDKNGGFLWSDEQY